MASSCGRSFNTDKNGSKEETDYGDTGIGRLIALIQYIRGFLQDTKTGLRKSDPAGIVSLKATCR